MNRPKQHGFTLYELLITLLVIGIVLVIGVPNLSDFTRNSRITGAANGLHTSFMVARSEAARAKTNIPICASAAPMSAGADGDGASFDGGRISIIDEDGNDLRDAAEEHVLSRH